MGESTAAMFVFQDAEEEESTELCSCLKMESTDLGVDGAMFAFEDAEEVIGRMFFS